MKISELNLLIGGITMCLTALIWHLHSLYNSDCKTIRKSKLNNIIKQTFNKSYNIIE